MKISVNNPCPCGSKKKYKKCCQIYHKGAHPKDALTLMKSRFSAYVVGDANYIIKTTHPHNPDYHDNHKVWREEILRFSKENHFLDLSIESFEEEKEQAYVMFKVTFEDGLLHEKSRFVKNGDIWLYIEADIKNR